jgi:hypothetical protein
MSQVLFREGDCFKLINIHFSREGALEFLDMSQSDIDKAFDEEDNATDMTVDHFDNNVVVIAVFNADGESANFIGHYDDFLGEI